MKRVPDVKKLPGLVGMLGVLGFVLRFALYLIAVDEKNLLLRTHPLEWALAVLTALTAVLVLVPVSRLEDARRYEHNFGASSIGALGSFAFGAAVLLTVLGAGLPGSRLELALQGTGLLAAGALVWLGVCRWRGEKPFFLLPCAVCVYLAMFMITHYQSWSSNPQLQDYVFQLLAAVCFTLFAYEHAAVSLDQGRSRRLLAAGLLGFFGAVVALAHTREGLIYLTGAVWCLTNLASPEPAPEAEPSGEAEAQEEREEAP